MTAPTPAPELEAEAPESPLSDASIRDAIAAEFASRPQPRQITLGELYAQFSELVLSHVRGRRIVEFQTEANAVRVLELALMWALNNRNQGGPAMETGFPTSVIGEGDEPAGPEPHETIEALPDEA